MFERRCAVWQTQAAISRLVRVPQDVDNSLAQFLELIAVRERAVGASDIYMARDYHQRRDARGSRMS
jgi:hypothetical protein